MSEMILVSDGACEGNYNKRGKMSAGFVILKGDEVLSQKHIKLPGLGSNNQAEIMACMLGIDEAKKLGAKKVTAYTDNQLLARQYSGEYRIKDSDLRGLHKKLRDSVQGLEFDLKWHRRETALAQLADNLSKGILNNGTARIQGPNP